VGDKLGHQKQEEAADGDWLDRLARFNLHFGRFLRDALGTALIALAFMALLAIWGVTKGVLLTPLSSFLSIWLGWGTYLLVSGMAYGGVTLIRRHSATFSWGRVWLLEIAAFLSLGLLSLLGGNSLVRADAGMDGGRLGWGIAFLLSRALGWVGGAVLLIAAWLLAASSGFGLWSMLEHWLSRLAAENQTEDEAEIHGQSTWVRPSDSAVAPASKTKAGQFSHELRSPKGGSPGERERRVKAQSRADGLPPLSIMLSEPENRADERTINQTAGMITKTLGEFGIPATVIGYRVGPAITQFAVQPGFIKRPGTSEDDDAQQMKVRVAQIANLQKDLALALSAERLRIEAPVPGKPYVGIEVPNAQSSVVRLKPILESEDFRRNRAPLAIALGRDVSGNPVLADLGRMPHLLIAGATGSGKSVCITSLAACLALNNSPIDLQLIMIDSKMVELLRFNGLPHLAGKVETRIDRILALLRWVVAEMENRYRLLEGAHVRDLAAYNRRQMRKAHGEALPNIVVLVDELADLMMSAPDETEHNLVRLAQMARATGIHLVVATQRPSTDVVTGVIKANFPARLAFAVASGVDSRVILDMNGAETLLGHGDMLFLNPELGTPVRAQGVMVTDAEIERIIDFWRRNYRGPVMSIPRVEDFLEEREGRGDDGLIDQAIAIVRGGGRASASLLQRRLRIGYPRAARLLDELEEAGVVGPSQGGGKEREVLPHENDSETEKE
jgi:S-DNA-T family DNA segregation ATPase FtsK/SpoIIIE